MKTAGKFALRALGLVLLFYLLARIDLNGIWRSYVRLDVVTILLVLGASYLMFWLKLERWRVILAHLGAHLPAARTRNIYWTSLFWGAVTPGRAGELYRAYPISKETDVDLGILLAGAVLDRFLDVAILLATALVFLIFWVDVTGFWPALVVASIVALALLTFAIKYILESEGLFRNKFRGIRKNILDGIYSISKIRLIIIIILTLFAYLFFYIGSIILASILLPNISMKLLLVAVACGSIVSILPISISGLGTRDITILTFFAASGHHAEEILAYSLGLFAFFNLLALVTGSYYWLFGKQTPD